MTIENIEIAATNLTPTEAVALLHREAVAEERWNKFKTRHPSEAATVEQYVNHDIRLANAMALIRYTNRYRYGAVNEALFLIRAYQKTWPGR